MRKIAATNAKLFLSRAASPKASYARRHDMRKDDRVSRYTQLCLYVELLQQFMACTVQSPEIGDAIREL